MAIFTQHEFQWDADLPPADLSERVPPNHSVEVSQVLLADEGKRPAVVSPSDPPMMPVPSPLPESVASGVFGMDEDQRPIIPSPEEIEAITNAHAERLMDLHDVVVEAELALSARQDQDRTPLYETKNQAVMEYQRGIARYAEDFGPQAAVELEAWLRHRADAAEGEWNYPPDHPWHYLQRGDGEVPLPVEDIRPASGTSHLFTMALPKNPVKRREKLQTMLRDQEAQLDADRKRYTQIAEGGAGVLSDFDRNIAHAGDEELAWASAVALKYCQIRHGLHRMAWLREQLDRPHRAPRQTPEG